MAVIRAKRLWLTSVPTGTTGATESDETPEVRSTAVYTCPQGKRAIVRSMSFIHEADPVGGTEPIVRVFVQPPASPETLVWRFTFLERTEAYATLLRSAYWNMQLVLHAGDLLRIAHTGPAGLAVQGSGHELAEISGG